MAGKGQEKYALVLGQEASSVKEKLGEYGAAHILHITAPGNLSANPDLQALAVADAVKEYQLDTLLGTASAMGKDMFARIAAILEEPLVSDCVAVNIKDRTVKKSHFSGKTFATLKINCSCLLCTLRPNSIEPDSFRPRLLIRD